MLLGEALQEFQEPTGEHVSSPVEEARWSMGSTSGVSPLPAGPRPIDTSEAVVGPFVDAAFQYFGVEDETQPVACPLPPVEEWLPAVLELMKSPARPSSVDVETAPEDAVEGEEDNQGVEGFTHLLADVFLEIASEEVKEQGPRIFGWRRPCFGEAPLARFREKQAQEGLTSSSKHTWEKVRAKLTEAVRFGWREEDEPTTGRTGWPAGFGGKLTLDLDPWAGGHRGNVALPNLNDESLAMHMVGVDAILEDEIGSDEASWLDIKADVQKVKNEVVQMIFVDLVDEMASEIASLWPVSPACA